MLRHRPALTPLLPSLLLISGVAFGQTDWNAPFPAHKIAGNIYYVGTEQLASFLITTPEGHILINSDFETSVPVIRQSVEQLGFKFSDIKVLLGSHAHGDHMEGDALVKEFSGAQVMAMEQDVPGLRAMTPGGKPHPIDRILHDGDKVELGGTTLIANLTAGHTPGCTSWSLQTTENGRTYNVVIVGSVGVNPGYILVNNTEYPQIADDYRRSFEKLRNLPADIMLGAHGAFYGLAEKYKKMQDQKNDPNAPNPFVDPTALRAYANQMEATFAARLAEQQAAAR